MEEFRLDVLLINPGSIQKRVYQELGKEISAIETPFWAALTAGFLRKNNFKVDILDANAENIDTKNTAQRIIQISPKLVNIVVYGQHPSASTQMMTSVGELCREIKRINPSQKIILTGIHPAALPEKTLQEEECDYVAKGEGFFTIKGLSENKPLNEIPGLWYKENNNIKFNPNAPLIKDLDNELSEVAWDLLPMNKYRSHNWHALHDLGSRSSYAAISTSLGCPFNCSFCCINAPFGNPSYRTWSPEWTMKQLGILVNTYGIKNIKFIDELFVLKPDHFRNIAEMIIQEGFKVNIWAYSRVDTIKEEDLPTLKKAGINWLALGIESADTEVLQGVSKGKFEENKIKEVIQKIKNSGINIIGNYIFGLPDDNLKTMQKTLDLAIELNCEFVNIYCATAYPGSRLYVESIESNTELPEKWQDFGQQSYNFLPLPTKEVSPKKILEFRDNAFNLYFTSLKYLDMVEKKFGIQARQHIEEMTKFKLKRKILEN